MPAPAQRPVHRSRIWLLFEVLAGAITGRWRRFEIADHSMRPALEDGDWVLAIARPRRLQAGDIVVCDFPARPGFAIVKRIAAIDSGAQSLWLLGDDPTAGSVDSRSFGAVPEAAATARLVARYRPFPPRLIR